MQISQELTELFEMPKLEALPDHVHPLITRLALPLGIQIERRDAGK
jgi:REP element-mobilizing transposase RayT